MAEFIVIAEKVFNNRETSKDRQTKGLTKALERQMQGLNKVLLSASRGPEVRRQALATGGSLCRKKGLKQ